MILKDSDIIIRTATDNDKYNIIELLNNVFKDQQHTDYTKMITIILEIHRFTIWRIYTH